MSLGFITRRAFLAFVGVLSAMGSISSATAGEILITDRPLNRVVRYTEDGTFIGVLVTSGPGDAALSAPSSVIVSPDGTKLYIASSANSRIVKYDYDYLAGTASNPSVLASFAAGLIFPNSMLFSDDGDTLYVSDLASGGVVQLNPETGATVGSKLTGGSTTQYSGLARGPSGELLVAGFRTTTPNQGNILHSGLPVAGFTDLVASTPNLYGAANLLVIGNDLYVVSGDDGSVRKYNATTGAVDGSFTAVTGLGFPAAIMAAPDGNGILVSDLGVADGGGKVLRYGFNGTPLGTFAEPPNPFNPALGFREATNMYLVPEPSSVVLMGLGLVGVALAARRRRSAR